MRKQVGKYHFGRHHRNWGIWQYEEVSNDGASISRYIKDVHTYEEAVTEVYKLNGWGQPKHINRLY